MTMVFADNEMAHHPVPGIRDMHTGPLQGLSFAIALNSPDLSLEEAIGWPTAFLQAPSPCPPYSARTLPSS